MDSVAHINEVDESFTSSQFDRVDISQTVKSKQFYKTTSPNKMLTITSENLRQDTDINRLETDFDLIVDTD